MTFRYHEFGTDGRRPDKGMCVVADRSPQVGFRAVKFRVERDPDSDVREFTLTKAETPELLAPAQHIRLRVVDLATILVNGSYSSPCASGSSPPSAAACAFPRAVW